MSDRERYEKLFEAIENWAYDYGDLPHPEELAPDAAGWIWTELLGCELPDNPFGATP